MKAVDPLPGYGTIYLITNKVNGKQYIGQTVQSLAERRRQHTYHAKVSDGAINRAMRKYGIDSFVFRELSRVDLSGGMKLINKLEADAIVMWDTLVPRGYNLASGGGNSRLHPSTKAKISQSLKGHPVSEYMRARSREVHTGNQYCKDRPVPPEVRAKISANLKGRFRDKVFSPETRARISAGLKGRIVSAETRARISASKKGKPSNRKGSTHTPEARAKMSASHKGKDLSRNTGRKHTLEARRNMSLAHLGEKHLQETIAKRSAALRRHHELRRAKLNGQNVGSDSESQ